MDRDSIKRLREHWGFVITDERDPDLFGWLMDQFLEKEGEKFAAEFDHTISLQEQTAMHADAASGMAWVKLFVEFARERLRENPPTSMTYLPKGIAVQLQNYQQLVFVEPKADAPANDDTRAKGAVAVTNFSRRGGGPPGHPQKDTAAPVTGTGRPKK